MFIVKISLVEKGGPMETEMDSASLKFDELEDASEMFDAIVEDHDLEVYETGGGEDEDEDEDEDEVE
jgi:hypothetical protein